jgi:hypothetical protein
LSVLFRRFSVTKLQRFGRPFGLIFSSCPEFADPGQQKARYLLVF